MISTFTRRWTPATVIIGLIWGLLAAVSASTTVASAAHAADGDPTQISEGTLSWGVKYSWRGYAGQPMLSGGATQPDPWSTGEGGGVGSVGGPFEFPISSGSFDPATGTTEVLAEGSVQWQKYWAADNPDTLPPGYPGSRDFFILDVTISDPGVTISAEGAHLTAEVVSRSFETMELVDYGRIRLVDLGAAGVTPAVAGGTTTWTDLTASLTEVAAQDVFSGTYKTGQVVDPVTLTYTGPGGPPVLAEEAWTEPDTTGLAYDALGVGAASSTPSALWAEPDSDIVHLLRQYDEADNKQYLQAFRLSSLTPIGTPLEVTQAQVTSLTSAAFAVPEHHELYLSSVGGGNATTATGSRVLDRVLRWYPDTESYSLDTLATPLTVQGATAGLPWDSANQRAATFQRVVPPGASLTDYAAHQWWLNTYTRAADGTFVEQRYRLPDAPTGYNQYWWNTPGIEFAADGSLVVAHRNALTVQSGLTPAVVTDFPARRILLNLAATTVEVQDLAGTDAGQATQTGYTYAFTGADGSVSLLRPGTASRAGAVQQLVLTGTGEVEAVGAQVALPTGTTAITASQLVPPAAVDGQDGTLWTHTSDNQHVFGVRDGRLVHDQIQPRLSQFGGGIVVTDDHDVYVATTGDDPVSAFTYKPFGFARLAWQGYSPAVTVSPQDTTVELTGAAEQVTLSAEATGTPAPEVQWQQRPVGALRFTDLAGQAGDQLVLDVTEDTDGTRYRAVFVNAAGSIVSQAATVTVHTLPSVTRDLADATVSEGTDAVFELVPAGNPEPEVTWQRRVAGFWQSIAPDDENFIVTNGSLTVTDTNADQSGSLFRARVNNTVGTVHTRAATLTVSTVEIPAEGLSLDGVVMEWSGSAELQSAPPIGGSNFFSAGVSDGTESTYGSTVGEASVFQVSSSGVRTPATWGIRAQHVSNGGSQLVVLDGGDAEIEQDGSAVVEWGGSWSVNFYGGIAPFTLTDPVLRVSPDGTGELTADLSGYASSQANPDEQTPLPPAPDVTVATFDGVEIDPAGAVTVTPHYSGVAVTVPEGNTPQDRSGSGWGAWPQEFVDFQVDTGLSSYWYSSGGSADGKKPGSPFTVDFTDAEEITEESAAENVASMTTVRLGDSRAVYGTSTTATVHVTADGLTPTGVVTTQIAGVSVTGALVDGSATLELPPGVAPGRHQVTVTYPGGPGAHGSTATTSLWVTKAKPEIRLKLVKATIKATRRGTVVVTVALPGGAGIPATGQIVIRDGGRVITTKNLWATSAGKVRIRLPRLDTGKHHLRAVIGPNALQVAQATTYQTLRVT